MEGLSSLIINTTLEDSSSIDEIFSLDTRQNHIKRLVATNWHKLLFPGASKKSGYNKLSGEEAAADVKNANIPKFTPTPLSLKTGVGEDSESSSGSDLELDEEDEFSDDSEYGKTSTAYFTLAYWSTLLPSDRPSIPWLSSFQYTQCMSSSLAAH